MLFFENIDISFRPELDKIGIMFKKGNTGGSYIVTYLSYLYNNYAIGVSSKFPTKTDLSKRQFVNTQL